MDCNCNSIFHDLTRADGKPSNMLPVLIEMHGCKMFL